MNEPKLVMHIHEYFNVTFSFEETRFVFRDDDTDIEWAFDRNKALQILLFLKQNLQDN